MSVLAESEGPLPDGLPQRLRHVRRGILGETQERMGRRLNISGRQLQKYEKGKAVPSICFLLRFCEASGVRLTWVLTGEGAQTDEVMSVSIRRVLEAFEREVVFHGASLSPCKRADVLDQMLRCLRCGDDINDADVRAAICAANPDASVANENRPQETLVRRGAES